jgi:glycosyltransferase involved in cell wall biosynthesis
MPAGHGPALAVVVPLYNEVEHVAGFLRTIPPWIRHVVVVNDASTDGSDEEVRSLCDPRVRLLHHVRRKGVGCALGTGFREALRLGGEIMITMDADGQMAAEDLPRMLEPLLAGRADYAKGCRFHAAISLHQMPWRRRLANRALSRLSALVLEDAEVRDAQCGFTATRAALVRRLRLEDLHPTYGVYNDILSQVLRLGARVVYPPVQAVYRGERSHFRARDLLSLAALFVRLIRRRSLPRLIFHPGGPVGRVPPGS